MLKEKSFILSRINALLDLALSVAAFYLAYGVYSYLLGPYFFPNLLRPSHISNHTAILILQPPLTVLMLLLNEHYASRRRLDGWQILRRCALSILEASLATLALIFFFQKAWLSRSQLVLTAFFQFLLIGGHTLLVYYLLTLFRKKGYNFRTVVLVGSGEALRHFVQVLEHHPFWGFKILGIISDLPLSGENPQNLHGYPIVANLDNGLDYLWNKQVDEVIFAPGRASYESLEPLLAGCEEMGLRTHFTLGALRGSVARPVVNRFEDIPVVTYSPSHPMSTTLLIKHLLDRILGAFFLILVSPLFVLIALAIRLSSKKGEPVFYGQTRCGLNGRPFTCWKFRSMRVGADQEKEFLQGQNEMEGPVFKMKKDPRVTKLGALLRRASLDELPQLVNVLRGEMSLVGPRPPLPEEVERYDRWQRRRLSMKPGLTCLWQVRGRNKVAFETWMRLDLEYIDNWSLLLDGRILLQTVFVVLTGRGAM